MSHSFRGRLRRQQDIVVLRELSFHPAVENDATRNDPKIVDHTHTHTKSCMFWSHQYRAKTRRDKDNIQNKLMQRCHVKLL